MANTLGLVEVNTAQLADSTNAINAAGNWDKIKVVRVTDHVSNVVAEVGSDTEKMAIFECRAKGYPWERRGTQPKTKIVKATAPLANTPKDFEVLYPNWNYAEFQ